MDAYEGYHFLLYLIKKMLPLVKNYKIFLKFRNLLAQSVSAIVMIKETLKYKYSYNRSGLTYFMKKRVLGCSCLEDILVSLVKLTY